MFARRAALSKLLVLRAPKAQEMQFDPLSLQRGDSIGHGAVAEVLLKG